MDKNNNFISQSEVYYFEILRGIDNYLRAAILNSCDLVAYPFNGAGMCEKAAKELKSLLPMYIDAQSKILVELYSTKSN